MKYEDQGLKTSDDDPENKAINAVKATIDVDDEDVIDAFLASGDVTPGPSTRTVFGMNLDIMTRAQTFRDMVRTKKAKGTKRELNSTKMFGLIFAGTEEGAINLVKFWFYLCSICIRYMLKAPHPAQKNLSSGL